MKSKPHTEQLVTTLERHSGIVIIAALVMTTLLILPMTYMAPADIASQDPEGEIFDLQNDMNDRFDAPFHQSAFIAEARGGDILTQASLWELYQNSQSLLDADAEGSLAPDGLPLQPYLYPLYNPDTGRQTVGIQGSMAHAVQQALVNDVRLNTSLEDATNDQVKVAIHHILSSPSAKGLRAFQVAGTVNEKRIVSGEEIDYWTSPATIFSVVADNAKLGDSDVRGPQQLSRFARRYKLGFHR
jgi:hypothetical protein